MFIFIKWVGLFILFCGEGEFKDEKSREAIFDCKLLSGFILFSSKFSKISLLMSMSYYHKLNY